MQKLPNLAPRRPRALRDVSKYYFSSIYVYYYFKCIPKRVLNGNFHTTRPVGRPRTRWADMVKRDASQLLGIRG
jgi:hypothetical protein